MRIELTKARGHMPKGHVFDTSDGVGNLYIRRGLAREVASPDLSSQQPRRGPDAPKKKRRGRHGR